MKTPVVTVMRTQGARRRHEKAIALAKLKKHILDLNLKKIKAISPEGWD